MDDIPFAKAIPVVEYAGPLRDPTEPMFWPDGQFLVMRADATLPSRCIKCNRATNGLTIRKTMLWVDEGDGSAGGTLRFVPYLRVIPAAVSMFRWFSDLRTTRLPTVTVSICDRHLRTSRIATIIAYSSLPLATLICFADATTLLKIWVPILGFFTSTIVWKIPRPVKAVHVGIGYVTLAGCGKAFLDSIPPKPHPRR